MIPISDAQSGNDSARSGNDSARSGNDSARSGNDSTRSGNNSGMPEAVAVDQAAKRAIIPWLPEGKSWTLPSDYRLHSRDKPADETINYVFTVLLSQSVALPTGVTFDLVRDLNRPSSAYHKLFEIEGDTQDELLERMSLRWVNAKTLLNLSDENDEVEVKSSTPYVPKLTRSTALKDHEDHTGKILPDHVLRHFRYLCALYQTRSR
jgi:hypothetical protein